MIKPKSVEVYPVYICPACSDRHVESFEYVKKMGRILCQCGELMILKPINTFNVIPVYAKDIKGNITPPPIKKDKKIVTVTKQTKPKSVLKSNDEIYSQLENILSDENVEQAQSESKDKMMEYELQIQGGVELLTSLGWKKREAKDRVIRLALKFEKEKGCKVSEESSDDFMNFLFFNH